MTREEWNKFFYEFVSSGGAAYFKPLFLVFGVYLPYPAAFYVLVRLASSRSFKLRTYYVLLSMLSILISEAMANFLRNIFKSLRPYAEIGIGSTTGVELGYGMPSSHMAFFVPLALILFDIDRRAGFIFAFFVVLMGISRALLLLHYPTDIILGIAVGVVGYFSARALLPRILTERK